MPSGKTHAMITGLACLSLGAWQYISHTSTDQIAPIIGGCALGVLLTPDLDVRGEIRSNYVVDRTLGGLVGLMWRFIWRPYALLIPHHRHFLSHFPIVGTLGRSVYIGLVAWLISWLIFRFAGVQFDLISWIKSAIGAWPGLGWLGLTIIGLAISDILHWVADSL